jgi:hypothetical protein
LRDEGSFEAGNLQRHGDYWKSHILLDHPEREELLSYLKGVSYTSLLAPKWEAGVFEGIAYPVGSRDRGDLPAPNELPNHVDGSFEPWVDDHKRKKLLQRKALRAWGRK